LAQYLPFDHEVEGCESVHDDLVSAACQSVGGAFSSLADCQAFIKNTWQIELEVDEVRAARERLEGEGLARRQGGGLALTPAASKRLEDERQSWEHAEQTAIDEWESALRLAYPLLTDEQVAALRQQIRPWVDWIIARHGAEASLLLFPDDDRAIQLVESMVETGANILPALDPDLEAIRPSAFRLLVHEPTKAQRERWRFRSGVAGAPMNSGEPASGLLGIGTTRRPATWAGAAGAKASRATSAANEAATASTARRSRCRAMEAR
jgi:hypothetical protein